jgi:anionic cell wall polymer biosynthesis LytR-Cps2A-Psr (LCP) family protein
MKQQLNETKRMQQLAGILKESQLNEAPELLDIMKDYISNVYTLDQGWDYDEDELNAEQESIKSQIIKAKGEAYFEALDDFAQASTYSNEYAGPEEAPKVKARMQELAKQLGFSVDQLIY